MQQVQHCCREDSMYAPGWMTGEIETRGKAAAIIANLTALLGLFVLGYPLAPATIRAMLLGWILIVVSLMQSIVGQVQARPSPLTIERHSYSRPPERERIAMGTLRGRM